jgi:hypothetical protein
LKIFKLSSILNIIKEVVLFQYSQFSEYQLRRFASLFLTLIPTTILLFVLSRKFGGTFRILNRS